MGLRGKVADFDKNLLDGYAPKILKNKYILL